jgi:hypothetical protein
MLKKILGVLICATWFSAYAAPVNISKTVLGGTLDDQVSPGCEQGNIWDLESTLLDGTQLSIVASYNLKTGQDAWVYKNNTWNNMNFYSGDIFIDVNADAQNYSNPAVGDLTDGTFTNSHVKYDYVFDMDFAHNTYKVIKLNDNSLLSNVYWDNYNFQGNPCQYVSGGTQIGATYTLSYQTGLSDNAALGYTSWEATTKHNKVTVDLANLGLTGSTNFTSHFSISCGNDVGVGQGTISVPEPSSLSMIFVGLLSLAGFAVSRKRK